MSAPMINIAGADKQTLRDAKDALIEIIKAAGTESAVIASVNALVALAKAPESVSIANCSFDAATTKRKRK